MHYRGTTPDTQMQDTKSTTKHGFLVALGWVAQKLGLREALERHVQVKQKTINFTPVDKIIEALVGILGDCSYMKDLNCEAEPIATDHAVAKAGGQKRFAHFSTVCATFAKLTSANITELSKALDEVQAPRCAKRSKRWLARTGKVESW